MKEPHKTILNIAICALAGLACASFKFVAMMFMFLGILKLAEMNHEFFNKKDENN